MSSLVSEFLINPVLRQARRFSRSDTSPSDLHESNVRTAPQLVGESEANAVIVEHVSGDFSAMELPNIRGYAINDDIPLLSGREDDVIEAELRSTRHQEGHDLRHGPEPARVDGSQPPSPGLSPSQIYTVDGNLASGAEADVQNTMETLTSNVNHQFIGEHMSPADGTVGHLTQDSTLPLSGLDQNSNVLPADDGMGPLRQRILYIQSMDIPAEQKAHLMHQLLTQDYTQAHEIFRAKHETPPTDPAKLISQERPATPGTLSSFIWQMNGTLDAAPTTDHYTFHLSPDDLKKTYAPLDLPEVDDPSDESENIEDAVPVLGCRHYQRNVKLQCSTCERWYTCRLCHDEVEDHVLIRHETKNMLCMICGCAQRAGEFCVECGERTAWYYCGVCKLWDNDSNKNIYHCNDCGICRKGRGLGKDFFHCKTCGVCMAMSVLHDHKCIERVSDCNCPICGEYMFTSPKPVVFMSCGHSIHSACYSEHMNTSYKCPICNKSLITMETQFRNLDRAINEQPMPPQFQNTLAMISCNDCYAKSAVKYHWLGLKCAICDSYNTAQLSILSDPASEGNPTGTGDGDNTLEVNQESQDINSSTYLAPGSTRNRRHSSHVPSSSSQGEPGRISPFPLPSRLGRSVSPARGLGLFNSESAAGGESDGSGDEDDMDFWGRDEPRTPKAPQNDTELGAEEYDEIEYEEGSTDSESGNEDMDDDDDDDGEDEEPFAIFGHR